MGQVDSHEVEDLVAGGRAWQEKHVDSRAEIGAQLEFPGQNVMVAAEYHPAVGPDDRQPVLIGKAAVQPLPAEDLRWRVIR